MIMLSSTSLLHGNCVFNRNNTVATQQGMKTYWLCKSYRISMCRARCITHQGRVISATGVHNHPPHMRNELNSSGGGGGGAGTSGNGSGNVCFTSAQENVIQITSVTSAGGSGSGVGGGGIGVPVGGVSLTSGNALNSNAMTTSETISSLRSSVSNNSQMLMPQQAGGMHGFHSLPQHHHQHQHPHGHSQQHQQNQAQQHQQQQLATHHPAHVITTSSSPPPIHGLALPQSIPMPPNLLVQYHPSGMPAVITRSPASPLHHHSLQNSMLHSSSGDLLPDHHSPDLSREAQHHNQHQHQHHPHHQTHQHHQHQQNQHQQHHQQQHSNVNSSLEITHLMQSSPAHHLQQSPTARNISTQQQQQHNHGGNSVNSPISQQQQPTNGSSQVSGPTTNSPATHGNLNDDSHILVHNAALSPSELNSNTVGSVDAASAQSSHSEATTESHHPNQAQVIDSITISPGNGHNFKMEDI